MTAVARTVFVMVFMLAATAGAAVSGSFYLHEHDAYWWFVQQEPDFSLVIPNDAERYVQKHVAGQDILEMTWEEGSVVMKVVSLAGTGKGSVLDSLQGQYHPLLDDFSVTDDREINTSGNETAHFWAAEGDDREGNRYMVRAVVFENDDHIVYLVMTLRSRQYAGDLREYWLRAVNGFQWD